MRARQGLWYRSLAVRKLQLFPSAVSAVVSHSANLDAVVARTRGDERRVAGSVFKRLIPTLLTTTISH